ncbi:hypothetical protein TERTU_4628 [Teredinibacter turnerae T7901]|uniref:Uncharacterized protein n=1 Tax=Teredinibacter turnerae (strain ATCC 39867 / T7901) TaxID=377629 RepID=C5BJY4_TERTT|nr:hypothetical protein TERTU_4628 [Teredinibacter turnerae T7901]
MKIFRNSFDNSLAKSEIRNSDQFKYTLAIELKNKCKMNG